MAWDHKTCDKIESHLLGIAKNIRHAQVEKKGGAICARWASHILSCEGFFGPVHV